jgi:WD40 repeat protein
MPSLDAFRKTEDEFFRLKGHHAAGRITNAQFETALKALMFEYDGHFWTLGASSGKWFYYDGNNWVEAEPPGANTRKSPPPEPKPPVKVGPTAASLRTSERKNAPKKPPPAVRVAGPAVQEAEIRRFNGVTGEVWSVAYSPDGRYGLTGDYEGGVCLWDIATGARLIPFLSHQGWVRSVAFSAGGRYVCSAGSDKTIRVGEVSTRREVRRLQGHTDIVSSAVFSHDGRRVLSGSEDKTVRLWDVDSGRELLRLTGHTKEVMGVAISPDGARAFSAGNDATLRLWDLQTGRELRRLELNSQLEDLVMGIACSPDGRLALVVTMIDIQMWDAESGRGIRKLEGPTGNILTAVFSPDGRRILSGSGSDYLSADLLAQTGPDNTVRLWDAKNGTELARLAGHTGNVNSVAFSSDGKRALSGSRDKTVRLWAMPD